MSASVLRTSLDCSFTVSRTLDLGTDLAWFATAECPMFVFPLRPIEKIDEEASIPQRQPEDELHRVLWHQVDVCTYPHLSKPHMKLKWDLPVLAETPTKSCIGL